MLSHPCLLELDRILEHFRGVDLTFEEKIEFLTSQGNGFVDIIGSGTSSIVFRVASMDQPLALKAIQDKDMYKREVAALQYLTHPNIISLKGFTMINRHYCLCLEHVHSESLWEFIRTGPDELDETEVIQIFTQLVSAVVYMHQKRVSHHDLNAQNILIDPVTKIVKIIDFGLAVVVSPGGGFVDHGFGTPLYLPLEVLEGRLHDPLAVDVWSLGVILVEMLLQTHPWKTAKTMVELAQMIFQRNFSHYSREISSNMQKIIDMMLTIDPAKRVTIFEVQQMLIVGRKN